MSQHLANLIFTVVYFVGVLVGFFIAGRKGWFTSDKDALEHGAAIFTILAWPLALTLACLVVVMAKVVKLGSMPAEKALADLGAGIDADSISRIDDQLLAKLRECLEIQGRDGTWNHDEYLRGMYNGMEFMLATIEDRPVQYRDQAIKPLMKHFEVAQEWLDARLKQQEAKGYDDPSQFTMQDQALEHRLEDDIAVDRFALAMKTKMATKHSQGAGGWDNPDDCTNEQLQDLLLLAIHKRDPVDVGNYAMMLYNRGQWISNRYTDALTYLRRTAYELDLVCETESNILVITRALTTWIDTVRRSEWKAVWYGSGDGSNGDALRQGAHIFTIKDRHIAWFGDDLERVREVVDEHNKALGIL